MSGSFESFGASGKTSGLQLKEGTVVLHRECGNSFELSELPNLRKNGITQIDTKCPRCRKIFTIKIS